MSPDRNTRSLVRSAAIFVALPLSLPAVSGAVSACASGECNTSCSAPAGFGVSTLVSAADLPGAGSAFTGYLDPNDGTDRRFLVTQEGVIWTYRAAIDDVLTTPFLDIQAKVLFPGANGESGLVSVALSPSYATDGEFYVYYSQDLTGTGDDDHMVIERYTRSANPDVANTTSTPILIIEHPATNHNGGSLAFGPDGFLYVSTGDGGGSCDSQGPNSQRTDRLNGKILRLDVADVDPLAGAPDDCARNGAAGAGDYEIPSTNPFFGQEPACDEVWAIGLRNPFRMTFDRGTGDIFFGDVGQNAWEEINFLRQDLAAPVNFGWKCREACQTSTCTNGAGDFCPDTLVSGVTACQWGADIDPVGTFFVYDPIYCHSNTPWTSIMGGYMYRGDLVPALGDRYFYSDYNCGELWVSSSFDRANPAAATSTCWVNNTGNGTSGFGEDHLGEVYIVRGGDARIDCIHSGDPRGCFWADDGLFSDGFDLNDTSRWSDTAP